MPYRCRSNIVCVAQTLAGHTGLKERFHEFIVAEIAGRTTAHCIILVDARLQGPFLASRQLYQILASEVVHMHQNILTACFMRTQELMVVEVTMKE
jgi:hypothetical protein